MLPVSMISTPRRWPLFQTARIRAAVLTGVNRWPATSWRCASMTVPMQGPLRLLAADAATVCSLFVAAVGHRRAVCHAEQSCVPPTGTAALGSAKYLSDLNEVKALSAQVDSTRTPEQSLIALFWADGVSTETPPGHWNSIAQEVGAARVNTMEQNARLFALL